jgi:DNA repair protein RecN (Recombination protein N)
VLIELRVRQLGVIDDVRLFLGPGMTALTGETGAGKTLVVEAIELLLGGRADSMLVRPGAAEATVEGRFTRLDRFGTTEGAEGVAGTRGAATDDEDLILARAVPAEGRSRAYVDGQMASLSVLGEAGRALVDLHGQHAHQSLLSPAVQRSALDQAAGIDLAPLAAARQRVREITEAQAALGGDARSRAREVDLLRFQLEELEAAGLDDPDEDTALADEEERLGDAVALRQATLAAHEALSGDGGVLDQLGTAVTALAGRRPVAALHDRLRALEAELSDAASDSRGLAEGFEDDPERLAEIAERRHQLRELRRKYGDRLADVIAYRDDARLRVEELESWERRAEALDRDAEAARAAVVRAEEALGAARAAAAPALGSAVEAELRTLALPRARFEVRAGPDRAGDEVTWMLAANPGEPLLPLTKVASGGELARTMLAARLVLSGVASSGPIWPRSTGSTGSTGSTLGARAGAARDSGPGTPARTLVFDEVDAGIGGEAAVAVGRALAALGAEHQVLVVTHLPQVAAFADHHLAVSKEVVGERTVSRVVSLDHEQRVVELSRMLSGQPNSDTARRHAEELLAEASPAPRPRGG